MVALLGFNVGLEVAQLMIVTSVLVMTLLMRQQTQRLQTAAVYAIGSMSIFWMWERALLLTT